MTNGRFSIFAAFKKAYFFVGSEWTYLLKASALTVVIRVLLTYFVLLQHADAGPLEECLWMLPSAFATGWFIFIEVRLILLGERYDRLPSEPSYLLDRRRAMTPAVILAVLFNMGLTAATTLLMALGAVNPDGSNLAAGFGALFLVGAIFWGLRLAILPIPAAVRFPLRLVLNQTRGLMFSLRLIVMAFLCAMPIEGVIGLFINAANIDPMSSSMPVGDRAVFFAATAPFSVLITVLVTAAATYALKEVLGGAPAGPGRRA